MKNIKRLIVADTKEMSRAEWLEFRRQGIGGSDAATVIGMNPWSSRYQLWADKKGLLPERPDTEAMRTGRDLEEYVAQRFQSQTGKKVRRLNAILRNIEYPWAIANIDRDIVGEDAGLECKTTSDYSVKRYGSQDFPEKYYCQCMHYMAVTGAKKWYLAVLLLTSREVYIYELDRNQDEIDALMTAEREFYQVHMLMGIEPAPDGSRASTETINELNPESNGAEVQLLGMDTILNRIARLKTEIDRLSDEKAEAENVLKQHLGAFERGSSDKYIVTWKNQDRKTFDSKKYIAENPGDYSSYYKTTTSRILKIREIS